MNYRWLTHVVGGQITKYYCTMAEPECINIHRSARQHVLISDNSPVRKSYFDSNIIYRMRMQGYCDVYKWTILKRTSPEVKCLHLTSSRREMCTLSVSNVIYHKFSHGAAFYTLNGKNVNVMLEFFIFSYKNTLELSHKRFYWGVTR